GSPCGSDRCARLARGIRRLPVSLLPWGTTDRKVGLGRDGRPAVLLVPPLPYDDRPSARRARRGGGRGRGSATPLLADARPPLRESAAFQRPRFIRICGDDRNRPRALR